MPELDPLPRRPRPPSFAPRTGDYAAVVGRAKRRRRKHLSGAGAGLAGVLAVVALTTGGAGTIGLRPVEPVTSPGGATYETGAPEESAAPDPRPAPSPEKSGEPAPDESPAPGDEPDAEVTIDPGPLDPGEDPHPPAAVRPVFVREIVPNDPGKVCETDPSFVTPTGWCLRYDGPSVVQVGVVHEYRLYVCRHLGRGPGTLTFGTEQQIDFRVTSGDSRVEWTWAGGYRFPKQETKVTVAEGRCVRWTVEWDATGNDGDPMRAGAYSFSPDLDDVDWGSGMYASASTAYPLEIVE